MKQKGKKKKQVQAGTEEMKAPWANAGAEEMKAPEANAGAEEMKAPELNAGADEVKAPQANASAEESKTAAAQAGAEEAEGGKTAKKLTIEEDELQYMTARRKRKRRIMMYNLCMCMSLAVFVICISELGIYYWESVAYRSNMNALKEEIGGGIVSDTFEKLEQISQDNGDVLIFPDEEVYEVMSAVKREPIGEAWADKYATLVSKNQDCFGYIEIPGTIISYPVMFTPENVDYYLNHNFEGEKERRGLPVMDVATKLGASQNYLIHGHNMKDETSFGTLKEYLKKSYYKEHKYIFFNTSLSEGIYEIMAVFKDKIYYVEDLCFKYYRYGGVLTKDEFETYVEAVLAESIYDTGVTAKWGDELITLSTCNRYTENGRLVIVAKRIA